jgi:hypothetical protein
MELVWGLDMPVILMLALVVVTVCSNACTTVEHDIVRGELVSTRQLDVGHDDQLSMEVDSAGRARVKVKRKTCTTSELTYAEVDNQEITTDMSLDKYGLWTLLGVGFTGLGVAMGTLAYAYANPTAPNQDALGALLSASLGVGLGSMIAGPFIVPLICKPLPPIQRSETVTLDTTQQEQTRSCEDTLLNLQQSLPYALEFAGERITGQTDEGGVLATREALQPLLAKLSIDAAAKPLALGTSLAARLTLGRAASVDVRLEPEYVADVQWAAWRAAEEARLSPTDQARFGACSDVARTDREVLACRWNRRDFDERVKEYGGTLGPSGEEFGVVHELDGRRGARFIVRVKTPRAEADWLLQVIDLETGQVIAESFTDEILDELAGEFPRDARYLLVLNAVTRDPYVIAVSVGGVR